MLEMTDVSGLDFTDRACSRRELVGVQVVRGRPDDLDPSEPRVPLAHRQCTLEQRRVRGCAERNTCNDVGPGVHALSGRRAVDVASWLARELCFGFVQVARGHLQGEAVRRHETQAPGNGVERRQIKVGSVLIRFSPGGLRQDRRRSQPERRRVRGWVARVQTRITAVAGDCRPLVAVRRTTVMMVNVIVT
jgi:hypothetical protein